MLKRVDFRTIDNNESDCWKVWIPPDMTNSLIKLAHEHPASAHCGIRKTLELLRRQFYWPRMTAEVISLVNDCDTCKETKAPNYILRPPMGDQIITERPWQHLYIDLLGPYPRSKAGNCHILIVVDQFSKFVLLKPLRKAVLTVI